MATEEEIYDHVQRIIDIKGKAIDLKAMSWVGLSEEDRAELKRLEDSFPDLLEEDRAAFEIFLKNEYIPLEQARAWQKKTHYPKYPPKAIPPR